MTRWAAAPGDRFPARRSRNAPPTSEARVPSPNNSSAASDSRASCVRRTATVRGSTGAPSNTTSANAPDRSNRSAHQGPRAGSPGRTTQRASNAVAVPPAAWLPWLPRPPRRSLVPCASGPAQSRGSSVLVASIHATPPPPRIVAATSDRAIVVLPSPAGARSSVRRPRGTPPPGSTVSSAVTPVGSPGVLLGVPATTAASCWRSRARDI